MNQYSWERKTPLTEQDIVDRAARSQNVYQGPLRIEPTHYRGPVSMKVILLAVVVLVLLCCLFVAINQ